MSRQWWKGIVGVLAAAAMLSAVTPAAAGIVGGGGKPGPREFYPSGMPLVFPAGVLCDFPLTISEVENKELGRTFPNGNTLVTGQFVVRVTNDDSHESVVRNISGPGVFGPDTITLSGSSMVWLFEGGDATGELGKGVFVTNGPVKFEGPNLVQAPTSLENLCGTLATAES